MDEEKQICKDDSTAIWFSDAFFKADADGKIVIPFVEKYVYSKAVLLSQGIADLENFTRNCEEYQFECFYNLHHESLLMGKNATLIITPTLKVNYARCSLDLIKKLEVKITMKSLIDDLPMTKILDDIEFNSEKDIVANFQVPPNLGQLDVTVTADIPNVTKGQCDRKITTSSYTIENGQHSTAIFKSYLRKYNGEYYFYLLGKAGEPIPNAEIEKLYLKSLVMDSKTYEDEFATDKKGMIKLGSLKEIVYLEINGSKNGKSFYSSWNLPHEEETFFYQNNLDYLEGEDVILPFPHDMFNSGCVSVLKFNQNNSIISNHFYSIEYQRKEGHAFGNIILKNLKQGKHFQFHNCFRDLQNPFQKT